MNSLIIGKIIFQKIPKLFFKEVSKNCIVFEKGIFLIDFCLLEYKLFRGEIDFWKDRMKLFYFRKEFCYKEMNNAFKEMIL